MKTRPKITSPRERAQKRRRNAMILQAVFMYGLVALGLAFYFTTH